MRVGFAALLSLLAAVNSEAADPPGGGGKPGPPAEEQATSEDAAVLSAALRYFAAHEDSGGIGDRKAKTVILIHTESAGPSGDLTDAGLRSDTRPNKWEVPAEVSASLRRRNTGIVPLGGLTFGKGVVAEDLGKPVLLRWGSQKRHEDVKAAAHVWMPGYSKDGRTAVVRFRFGPTPHGAVATYLLSKGEGGWTVTKWVHIHYV